MLIEQMLSRDTRLLVSCVTSNKTVNPAVARWGRPRRIERLGNSFTNSASPIPATTASSILLPKASAETALSRLPTHHIIRSLVLGYVLTLPRLSRIGIWALSALARTKLELFNADRNLALRAVIKPLIYDQFCAGTKKTEIEDQLNDIRKSGFSGAILGYGKEVVIHGQNAQSTKADVSLGGLGGGIDLWKRGNIETIEMITARDFLAIKLSGAGTTTIEALRNNLDPPPELLNAMTEIIAAAQKKKCRIIVDAEQQSIQNAIDEWTINWMREHNRNAEVLIYNTLQSYLKDSRAKLIHQLNLAEREGWQLAIKLVRGAYIGSDPREAIHNTKEETDENYNSIVEDVLRGRLPGFDRGNSPKMELFIAGHNQCSVDKAAALMEKLDYEGRLMVVPEFGQLQGMADALGCGLLKWGEQQSLSSYNRRIKVYKYSVWGSMQECMEYLVRRAVENRGAADRLIEDMTPLKAELRSRITKKIRNWCRKMSVRPLSRSKE